MNTFGLVLWSGNAIIGAMSRAIKQDIVVVDGKPVEPALLPLYSLISVYWKSQRGKHLRQQGKNLFLSTTSYHPTNIPSNNLENCQNDSLTDKLTSLLTKIKNFVFGDNSI